MSYDDLINTILLDYKIYSFTQCMDRPMSIGSPLFQYKETDYEFLRRVASQIGLEINSDIINTDNGFYFGKPSGRSYEIEEDIDYTASMDIKKYKKSLVHNSDIHPTDFFYYEIKTAKVMEIGARVNFKEKELYVYSYEAEYVRGDLIFTYRLCRQKGIWQEKLYNDKLKGISLEGRVMEVSGEQVKLHLNIDETQNQAKAAWFRYAPPTGNLMYSMPIVGTNANLYFPSERSEEPMVIGCVRKNGGSCEKCSNVNNRYFSTESGNNLDMLPDAINFSRPGLSANFNDGSGITLSSSSSLSINAGYVGMFAGNISIEANSKLEAKKGGSSLSLEDEFYNDASIVMENGKDRASNEPFDDDPQNGAKEVKAAAQFAVSAILGAVQGAIGKIGDCLAGGGESQKGNVESEANNSKSDEKSFLDSAIDFLTGAQPCYAAERDDEENSNTYNKPEDSNNTLPLFDENKEYNVGDKVKIEIDGKTYDATIIEFNGEKFPSYDPEEVHRNSSVSSSTGLAVFADVYINKILNKGTQDEENSIKHDFQDYIHNILKACSGDEQSFEGLSMVCNELLDSISLKSFLEMIAGNGKKKSNKVLNDITLEELLEELNSQKSLCEKLNAIINSDLNVNDKKSLIRKTCKQEGVAIDNETAEVMANMPKGNYEDDDYKHFRSQSKGLGSNLGQINAYYLLTGKEKSLDNSKYNKILMDTVGPPPANMDNPHAHHILYKSGNGERQKALVEEGQEILRDYDIDPIEGPENLCWAPNIAGQHNGDNLEEVVTTIEIAEYEALKQGYNKSEVREEIVKALENCGDKAANRKRKKR